MFIFKENIIIKYLQIHFTFLFLHSIFIESK
jgi:hypothetical protein